MDISKLRRGDVVVAAKRLYAADVIPGTMGVVFEEKDAHGGPMVRWMNLCACNIYDGDVIVVRSSGLKGTNLELDPTFDGIDNSVFEILRNLSDDDRTDIFNMAMERSKQIKSGKI